MDVLSRLTLASRPLRIALPVLAALVVVFLLAGGGLLVGPIPQPAAYHDYADQRTLLGIPHFWNVVSNLPILLAGLAGLGAVGFAWRRGGRFLNRSEAALWGVFFAAGGLTALGSTFYHLAPDTPRLFWDRLPLGLAAACLPAALLAERVALGRRGRAALMAWVLLGPLSAVHWIVSETLGAGDLRLYGLVQFGGLAGVVAILLLTRPRFSGSLYYWAALTSYALAKAAESWDGTIYSLSGLLSGHTLKHCFAALGIALLAHMVNWRRPSP